MEYFVTGGTGFLGTRLVAQLADGGHDVVALARSPAAARAALPEGVTVVAGDATRRDSMRDAERAVADGRPRDPPRRVHEFAGGILRHARARPRRALSL